MMIVSEFRKQYEKYKDNLDIILPEMKALGTYVGIDTKSFNQFYMGGFCEYFKGKYELYCMDYKGDKLNIIYYYMDTGRMFDYNINYASTYKIDLATREYENNRFRRNTKYEVIEQTKYEGVLPDALFDEKNIDGLTRKVIGKDFTDSNTYITQNVIYEIEEDVLRSQSITYKGLSYVFEPNKDFVNSIFSYAEKDRPGLINELSKDGTLMEAIEKGENIDWAGIVVTDKKYQKLKEAKQKELVKVLQKIKKV